MTKFKLGMAAAAAAVLAFGVAACGQTTTTPEERRLLLKNQLREAKLRLKLRPIRLLVDDRCSG